MAGRKRRKLAALLAALEHGAGTHYDLADASGLSVDSCRAILSELCRAGVVQRGRKVPREIIVTRPTPLYSLVAA